MTTLKAAQQQCANYRSDGTCLGIGFRADLSLSRFRKEGLPCLLHDGAPCPYFEECVMPYRPSRTGYPREATQLDEACHLYRTQVQHEPKAIKRLCRACRHRPVIGIKRYCVDCAANRKRSSQRASMRKSRSDVIKTANSLIGAEALTNGSRKVSYRYPDGQVFGDVSPTDAPKNEGSGEATSDCAFAIITPAAADLSNGGLRS
jgi:hypothetical protein